MSNRGLLGRKHKNILNAFQLRDSLAFLPQFYPRQAQVNG